MESIKLRFKSYNVSNLDNAIIKIVSAVTKRQACISGPIPMPTKIERFTVNRSTNIDKKSREQFEIRTYSRLLYIESNSGVIDALMKIETPSGIDIEIEINTAR